MAKRKNEKLKKAELEIVKGFNALYGAISEDAVPENLVAYIAEDEAERVIDFLGRIAAVHGQRWA